MEPSSHQSGGLSASGGGEEERSLTHYPTSVSDADSDCVLKTLTNIDAATQLDSPGQFSCSHNVPHKPGKAVLASAAAENCLSLKWLVEGSTDSISNFNIMHSPINASGKTGKWSIFTTDDAKTMCDLQNLDPGTSYKVRITAITDDGCSYQGDLSDILTTAKVIPPALPKSIRLVEKAGHDSMTITWDIDENMDAGPVAGYTVSLRSSESDDWTNIECVDKPVVLDSLKPHTKYYVKIVAHSKFCSSLAGVVSEPFSTALPPPSAPLLVTSSDQDKVTIGWEVKDILPNAIDNFTVFFMRLDDIKWHTVETKGPERSITIDTLNPEISYHFKVASNTNVGQSPQSRSTLITIPLPCPGIPCLAPTPSEQPTHDTLTLVWDFPTIKEKHFKIIHSTIEYRDVTQEQWQKQEILTPKNQGTIYGLKPETFYTVRVISHSQKARSFPSKVGGPFKTTMCTEQELIFKKNLKTNSQRVQSDKDMPLYQLPLKISQAENKLQRKEFGAQNMVCPKEEKVILIVGATGAGKSTFINGMINFILGTDWTDDFRFRLVEESGSFDSQHKSQTRLVTVYKLHHQDEFKIPFSLTIIDTPGYGDTDGIGRDKGITESIKDLFDSPEYGVDHIDAVGFVAQSSLARLTPTQRYIFDSILSLFGKDIESNIFLLITFCDPQKPPVLASIKEAKIPFHSSFKFNNSALFASNTRATDKEFNQIFWDMGTKGFQLFLGVLVNIQEKSLQLTKEVLSERHQLEVYIAGLQQDIQNGLSSLEQYRKEVQVVKMHEVDIKKNKDFTYKVQVQAMERKDLEPGRHVTNCLHCNRTCHYPCSRADDDHKKLCCVMKKGNCKLCQCHWDLHKNVPYRIIWVTRTEEKTAKELKQRYVVAQGKKLNAEILLSNILDDFYQCQVKVLCLTNEVRRSVKRLNEIALRRNPLSMADYLDILIGAQTVEAHPGWQDRVTQLYDIKAQAMTLSEVAEDEGYDPFEQYRELLKQATPVKKIKLKKIADDMRKKCKKTYLNARKNLQIPLDNPSLLSEVPSFEHYV